MNDTFFAIVMGSIVVAVLVGLSWFVFIYAPKSDAEYKQHKLNEYLNCMDKAHDVQWCWDTTQ